MSETLEHDESQSLYGPVTDWLTDFDHADPDYNQHAHEIWADMRDKCPVA
ncbi:MAG: cytochrome, partial [Ilumatobacteraceae bacterium]|nr:cytochrome [Ilumatobacteraceae bacterium]